MAVVPPTPFTFEDPAISETSVEKATFFQDTASENPEIALRDPNLLVVSPYEEEPHLLDLRTLDTENQLLARALVGLQCLREDYATAPYLDSFNWQQVIDTTRDLATISNYKWKEHSFYIVAFRSQVPPSTIQRYDDLGALDKAAHAEATRSGGFLKYWFGAPDKDGRNLATCLWRSLHDARVGSVGEAHRAAANAARHMYTEWRIERLRLTIKDDIKEWDISEWAN